MSANDVQNPGSAIGEAIGAEMEKALNAFLTNILEERGYHFVSKSPIKGRKKLILYDNFANDYNIDAVIANERMQPIILFESKYIRYKKHNRDKASWVSRAHPSIRRRYDSIRSSIAVLAGNWSLPSLAMLRSNDINVIQISFDLTCELLENFGIDFRWKEKERDKALVAWLKYSALTAEQKASVGIAMVDSIKGKLQNLVLSILDDSTERKISGVIIELHSNLGEVKEYKFATVKEAIDFLNTTDPNKIFIAADSLTLFEPKPKFADDAEVEAEQD